MTHFDLLIIGGGSGNSILTPEFEDWKVAIVERDRLGGTCLNVGCIPSKMLVLPADRVCEAAESADLGVGFGAPSVDWGSIRDRVFGRIDPIVESGTDYRRGQQDVSYFEGDARFTSERSATIALNDGGTAEVSADQVVLAAGARPFIPNIPGLADTPFHTSDTIMRIDELPEDLIIIGGGFIAAELGHVFSGLGSQVTVIQRSDHVLRYEDSDVSDRFLAEFGKRVRVLVNTSPAQINYRDGTFEVAVTSTDHLSMPIETIRGDQLLITTGRVPNSDQLGLSDAGIDLDENNYVLTDSHLRASASGVWALGDIRNPAQLKHLANQEARVVSHNLLHPDGLISIEQDVVPHAVFSHPQIGSAGLTEQALKEAGREYLVGRCEYGDVAYGWALEDRSGFAKLLIDSKSLEILGVHVIGPQAATLMQQIVQAMTFGITADRVAREQIWCHPALTEVLENALLDAL